MPRTVSRVILALLAATAAQLGLWATIAPRSFFEDFPGGGRHWVAVDGPYNEHLVRDFGGLNLALAFVLIVALVHLTPVLVRTAAIASLLFAVPHFVHHARHLDVLTSSSDKTVNMVLLGLAIGGPVLLLLLDNVMIQSTSKVPPARQ
jgi:sterol desaturase/sphingolipid hydroxylase (fatty acid hydroxylase superfamily)